MYIIKCVHNISLFMLDILFKNILYKNQHNWSLTNYIIQYTLPELTPTIHIPSPLHLSLLQELFTKSIRVIYIIQYTLYMALEYYTIYMALY